MSVRRCGGGGDGGGGGGGGNCLTCFIRVM